MCSNVKANSLIREKSPYLLQHANNPINWYAWGEEAFNKAKEEDKPIFIINRLQYLSLVPCNGT